MLSYIIGIINVCCNFKEIASYLYYRAYITKYINTYRNNRIVTCFCLFLNLNQYETKLVLILK